MRSDEKHQEPFRDWSQVLGYLLAARNYKDFDRRLERLRRQFQSLINKVLHEELNLEMPKNNQETSAEADIFNDISLEARTKIAKWLLGLWETHQISKQTSSPVQINIYNFRAYLIGIARNASVDYLRHEYPGRHSLDNTLREHFSNSSDLARWKVTQREENIEWPCGRAEWEEEGRSVIYLRRNLDLQKTLRKELEGLTRRAALMRVFEVTQAPLLFTELLSFLAQYWNVEEKYRQETIDENVVYFRAPKQYQSEFQPEEVANRIGVLTDIWAQVKGLKSEQIAVLLLKSPLSEEGNYLEAMVDFGITNLADLAGAMGLTRGHLEEVISEIPMDDEQIAATIGVKPRDVPRIRQDARRRLERRKERRERERDTQVE